jgi:hypothetical protein
MVVSQKENKIESISFFTYFDGLPLNETSDKPASIDNFGRTSSYNNSDGTPSYNNFG